MWVTSWPRRIDRVKAPGLDDDKRAKNEPSDPLSNNRDSASMPDIEG
jgi:hypothetical protein